MVRPLRPLRYDIFWRQATDVPFSGLPRLVRALRFTGAAPRIQERSSPPQERKVRSWIPLEMFQTRFRSSINTQHFSCVSTQNVSRYRSKERRLPFEFPVDRAPLIFITFIISISHSRRVEYHSFSPWLFFVLLVRGKATTKDPYGGFASYEKNWRNQTALRNSRYYFSQALHFRPVGGFSLVLFSLIPTNIPSLRSNDKPYPIEASRTMSSYRSLRRPFWQP